nr:dienelactone hydrolase family protein [Novosphingobium panipatense]
MRAAKTFSWENHNSQLQTRERWKMHIGANLFEAVDCEHEGARLRGRLLRPTLRDVRHPQAGSVLMFPGATGPSKSYEAAMRELADAGYLVLDANMYGEEVDLTSVSAAGQGFADLMADPVRLRGRAIAWFERLRDMAGVDPERIAAIGYCFGGKCVLELARSGAALQTVTSFHGLLTTHAPALPGSIRARVAIWTGGEDPYAPRSDTEAVHAELDAAGADYQLTLFAKARHAFMDPDHDGFAPGIVYDRVTHRIAWAATRALLSETIDATP